RPHFLPLIDWPSEIVAKSKLLGGAVVSIEVGLGSSVINTNISDSVSKITPILWCAVKFDDGGIFFFPDGEIPQNVGLIACGNESAELMADLKAISVIGI